MPPSNVAVLYAKAGSIYHTLPGVDVWDMQRDARLWPGGCPVVAHPPCRAWGRLRKQAKPRPDEKTLALHVVQMVRTYGGVLEHPSSSTLWPAAGLPRPGAGFDAWGGFSVEVLQHDWFHLTAKKRGSMCAIATCRVCQYHAALGQRTNTKYRKP